MKKYLYEMLDHIRNGKHTEAGNAFSEYITRKSKSIMNENLEDYHSELPLLRKYPYAQEAIEYFIHNIKEDNRVYAMHIQKYKRSKQSIENYEEIQQLIFNDEYSYMDNLEDIDTNVKEIVKDDPNW